MIYFKNFCKRLHLDSYILKYAMDKMSASPPNYQVATGDRNCGSCKYYSGGHCRAYDTDVDIDHVCDHWTDRR